jgi:hydrogenase small subunit
MREFSRREILQLGAWLAAGAGLSQGHQAVLASGLEKLISGQAKVLWLQGMSCSGCSVSFLNAEQPSALEILTEVISLVYHPTLSAAQGEVAQDVVQRLTEQGNYILVLEGTIPLGMPEACMVGGKPFGELLPPIIRNADCVVAAGTCSAFGGIPAAEGNLTAAVSVGEFMKHLGISVEGRLINCPGCPVHPESLLGTLAYVLAKGLPELDPVLLTPKMFYGKSVHDECPRFHYWEKGEFAKHFGDEGCLFELGCLGPLSHSNCPGRQWNGGVNWCVRASAPCIGCTSASFALKRDFPFYRKGEQVHDVVYQESERGGV